MMRYLVKIVLVAVLLAFPRMMPAQNLPALAPDASMTTGSLTNGITYHLVTNPSKKGMADFALLRRGFCDTLAARKELTALPHFNRTVPHKFLARKGIACSPDGFVSFKDDNTLFRFEDVPMFDQAAADTTLLMLFDLIAEQPRQHSIIIAGDINPGSIIQKMAVFSLMVPSRNPVYNPTPYAPAAAEGMDHSFTPSNRAAVNLEFRSPRTPPEMMKTIQPFIVKTYALQLAAIAKERLGDELAQRRIPCSELSVTFSGSDSGPGDESLKVRVETASDKLVPSVLAIASTLSELASKGVGEAEFVASKKTVLSDILGRNDNSSLVDRCVSSILYGSDLASPASKVQFLVSRALDSKREVGMFNDFAEAFLGDIDAARLSCSGDAADNDGWLIPSVFKSTWDAVAMLEKHSRSSKVSAADTLSLWNGKDKVKLKSSEPEPVSGGQMWTFSNGLRVIFKKTTSDKRFHYSMMVRGGYSSVRDLHNGEGAFFSDMLSLCDIAGMPGRDFKDMLVLNGVEMDAKVSVSDMRISGTAPSEKLSLLMKSLLSIANDRRPDAAAFDNYLRRESSRLATASIDSLLYPNYKLSSAKTYSGLTSQTQTLASAYFDKQFIKVNDGVLVLMGDLDPDHLQKFLCRCLGGFRVSGTQTVRPSVQYKLPSGSTTYSQAASPSAIKIAFAAAEPFTIESAMAFRIAVQALERALSGVMAQEGFTVSSTQRMRLSPQESVEAVLTLVPVPGSGMPLGLEGGEAKMYEALVLARKTIDATLSKPLPGPEFNACKAIQVNEYVAQLADPSNYIDAVLMRYSNAKDVLTSHNERTNSVGPDQVSRIFGVLAGGRRIEYVVKK